MISITASTAQKLINDSNDGYFTKRNVVKL